MTSSNEPWWHRDARVSLIMRAMNDARRHSLKGAVNGTDHEADQSISGTAQLRRTFDIAIKAGPDARATTVELASDGIKKSIAEMLFITPESVDLSKSVADHGVDSLISVELSNWFHEALGATLKNVLDSQTSMYTLAEQIVDEALGGVKE